MSGTSTSNFAPFTSGCGKCYPSTDYYQVNQKGGKGNYSENGLIPQANGKNFFKAPDFNVPMDKVMKDNYGIEYSTAFGGKKVYKKRLSSKKLVKKTSSKKNPVKRMKGGNDIVSEAEANDMGTDMLAPYDNSLMKGGKVTTKKSSSKKIVKKSSSKKRLVKKMKGGDDMVNEVEPNDIGTEMLAIYDKSDNSIMKGGKSIKKSSSKKLVKKSSTKKRLVKKMKGGDNIVSEAEANDMDTDMLASYNKLDDSTMVGGKVSKKSVSKKSSSKKSVSKKSSSKKLKKMKGGMESSGATPMDQRFYDSEMKYDSFPSNSGNGVMSAYGQIEVGNIGTGMLAPFTASTSETANHNTMMKTGGATKKKSSSKKSTKKTKKGGATKKKSSKKLVKKTKKSSSKKSKKGGDGIPYISDSSVTTVQNTLDKAVTGFSNFMQELDSDYLNSVSYLKNMRIGNQRLIQGGKKINNYNNNDTNYRVIKKSKLGKKQSSKKSVSKKSVSKKSSSKKLKKMKGGMESSGATPMDQRFYDSEMKYDSFPSNSGNGVMSAYGQIEVGNIGTGMLAPFTASTSETANPNTMMKTGGATKKKSSPKKLTKKSTKKTKKGGATKKKSSSKKTKKGVSTKKKSSKKTKIGKKLKGGDGSDFSSTLSSRGPANAPDDYWGVPGEKWFRQFNKTGEYIPNSQLPYAATPDLAGRNESGVVTGYDERIINNGVSDGV
jgi:hypothetical protein